MKSRSAVTIASSAILILIGGAALAKDPLPTSEHSPAFAGHRLAKQARVTLAKARTIAQAAQPGVFTSEELERERGGSGLRYSFDIRSPSGVVHEVGIDARTGKLLENSLEGPHPD